MNSATSFAGGKYFKIAIVGLYTWLATLSFGAALIDILYARLMSDSTAFVEVADFLLLLNGATLLAGFAAAIAVWNHAYARSLIFSSLLVIFWGLIFPPVINALLNGSDMGLAGPVTRLIMGGLVSLLGFAGLYKFIRAH